MLALDMVGEIRRVAIRHLVDMAAKDLRQGAQLGGGNDFWSKFKSYKPGIRWGGLGEVNRSEVQAGRKKALLKAAGKKDAG